MNGEAERLVIAVFLAFCRIGACFLVMPGTSSVRVPTQVRLFVALAATFAIFAHLSDALLPVATRNMTVLVPAIASELMVGGLIGLLARLYVMALQFMGTAIANLVGYGAAGGAAVEEPESQSPLASLISFSALLLLFVFDFHHQIIITESSIPAKATSTPEPRRISLQIHTLLLMLHSQPCKHFRPYSNPPNATHG